MLVDCCSLFAPSFSWCCTWGSRGPRAARGPRLAAGHGFVGAWVVLAAAYLACVPLSTLVATGEASVDRVAYAEQSDLLVRGGAQLLFVLLLAVWGSTRLFHFQVKTTLARRDDPARKGVGVLTTRPRDHEPRQPRARRPLRDDSRRGVTCDARGRRCASTAE